MEPIIVAQHDTSPLRMQLEGRTDDLTWQALNLAGATVSFLMGRPGALTFLKAPATIIDAGLGIVEYGWAFGGTEVAGDFWCEWEVVTAAGMRTTLPNRTYLQLTVRPDLG